MKKKKSILQRVIKTKTIVKPSKTTFTIKEREPAEYVSRYFKDEWEETKKSLFK